MSSRQVAGALRVDQDEGKPGIVQRAGHGEMQDFELPGFSEDGLQAEHTQRVGCDDTDTHCRCVTRFNH